MCLEKCLIPKHSFYSVMIEFIRRVEGKIIKTAETLRLRRLAPFVKIYAFEPDPLQ